MFNYCLLKIVPIGIFGLLIKNCVRSAAGISRSVTMTVMYIMTVSSLGFKDALKAVKHCRECANPNFGFRMQLQKYEDGPLSAVSIDN